MAWYAVEVKRSTTETTWVQADDHLEAMDKALKEVSGEHEASKYEVVQWTKRED